MIRKTAVLFLLWLLLSESLNPVLLVVGFLSAFGVAWVNRDPESATAKVSIGRGVAYVPWLLWQVLKSGLTMTRLILDPRLPIAPTLIGLASANVLFVVGQMGAQAAEAWYIGQLGVEALDLIVLGEGEGDGARGLGGQLGCGDRGGRRRFGAALDARRRQGADGLAAS